jgi:tetratricopeptide (TPR) repeat protein
MLPCQEFSLAGLHFLPAARGSFAWTETHGDRIVISWQELSKLEREKIVPSRGLVHISGMTHPRKGGMRRVFLLFLCFAIFVPGGRAQNAADSYRQTVLAIQQCIEENDLTGARALLDKAVQRFPANGGIENLVGVVEIQQGHSELAKQAFSLAIQHSPGFTGAYLNLARIYMQTAASNPEERAKALRLYEGILKAEPANAEANYEAATLSMWSQKYQRSLDYLEKLTPEARRQVGAESLLCADEAGLGHKEAVNRAAASLIANPDLAEQDAMTVLPVLRTSGRADLVESIFAAVAERHPLSAAGLRVMGLAQEAEGKLEQARATMERAFVADSAGVGPLIDLTRIAEAANDHKGALGYLAHARDLQPRDASLAYEFGAICLKLGLLEEARKAMGEAVKLAPDNPEYNFGMGTVSSFGQDPAEALPYLEKYHTLREEDAQGVLALGTTCFRAKDFPTASKWLKRAVNNANTAAEAHYYLGRIARQIGQLDEAIAQLMESAKLKPDRPAVLAELGQVYTQMKRYGDAEKQLNRAIALDANNYAANFGLLQLYARTGDSRREEQSKRFDAIKQENEEQARDMMRVIEVHSQAEAARTPQDK